MLKSVNEIQGFRVSAFDGKIGRVHEFLFDDETMNIKYVVINTGSIVNPKLVLIEPDVLGNPEMAEKELPVYMMKDEIINSPEIETSMPATKRRENYSWPYYWVGTGGGFPGVTPSASYGLTPFGLTPTPGRLSSPEIFQGTDSHLRSTRDLIGYKLRAIDRDAGTIDDFLLEDSTWRVPHMIAGTGSWILSSKKTLITMRWINEIDLAKESISVSLTAEELKRFPEYEPVKFVKRETNETLYEHFYKMIPGLLLNNRK